ncbi:glycerophosphodiester phosphodiesterase family protein [Streptomyces sp. NPDC047002]|uniref:glycerophosphodiester phosphodiesterase n=1 Tax=Streptomyces sp. NPDC047002 TaxID=3155475 RepID=UPI003451D270
MGVRRRSGPALGAAVRAAAVAAVVAGTGAWTLDAGQGGMGQPGTGQGEGPARAAAHQAAPAPVSFAALPRRVLDAHRGGGGEPGIRENSVSGAQKSLASGRVQVLDIDTRRLKDGTPVLMHDATVDRTTDHTGPVSAYTPATWKQVRLDTGGGAPEPAPTLDQYLDALGGRAVVTVEAKDASEVPTLASMIKARGLTSSVLVNTNDPAVARRIHAAGLLTHLWRSAAQLAHDDPRAWTGFVDLLDIDHRATDAQVRAAVHSGIPRVWAHTLTTAAQRDRMLALGVQGIITDYPLSLDRR